MKPASLTIVYVNFNGIFWLRKALDSLHLYYVTKTKRNVRTIVVDNGSSDGSVQALRRNYKWLEVVDLDSNKGFGAANNVALKMTTSPYVLLLNSDTELTSDTNIDLLIKTLEKNDERAVVTPKIVMDDGTLDWACHRGEPNLWNSFCYFSGLSSLLPSISLLSGYHLKSLSLESSHEVEACSAAAMLVRKSAIDEVGLFDEQFFMYAEDLDWCARFRQQGWTIWYEPTTTIIHHKYKSGISSSVTATNIKSRFAFYDTMVQYYDKHYRHKYPQIFRWLITVFVEYKKGRA